MAGEQFVNATLEVKRQCIRRRAAEIGVRVTSETSGKHAPGSLHYVGRAIDVSGAKVAMARFFRAFEPLAQRRMGVPELFFDPFGAYDSGRHIPPIGGHSDHVQIGCDPPP